MNNNGRKSQQVSKLANSSKNKKKTVHFEAEKIREAAEAGH